MKRIYLLILVAVALESCKKEKEPEYVKGPVAHMEFKGFVVGLGLMEWQYINDSDRPAASGDNSLKYRPQFEVITGGYSLVQRMEDRIPAGVKKKSYISPAPDFGADLTRINIYTDKNLDVGEYISYFSKTQLTAEIRFSIAGWPTGRLFAGQSVGDYTKIKIIKKYIQKVTPGGSSSKPEDRVFYDGEFEFQVTGNNLGDDACKIIEGKFTGVMLLQ